MPIEIVKDLRKTASLSIIIRCKNELPNISRLVKSIKSQTYTDYDIIFIDSGSIDGIVKYLKKIPYSIFTMPPEDYNHGTSCDQGAGLVDSPYIMFLSAHTYLVHKQMIENAIGYISKNPKIAGIYFRQVPNKFTGCSCLEQAYLRYRFPKGDECSIRNGNYISRISFSNAASIVRRSVWEEVPFGYCLGSEDRIWADKVIGLGYSIAYAPQFWVEHSHEETSSMVENRVFINLMAWNQYVGCKNITEWPLLYAMKKLILMIVFGQLNDWRNMWNFTMASYRGAKRAWESSKG
ncbi:MAG: glycosyltransferase [Thermodesulfobacteriota bacterium]